MTLKKLTRMKDVVELAPQDLLRAYDWIEWDYNAFTQVDPRSLFVGKPVAKLRQVHIEGRLAPARAYRQHSASNVQQLAITSLLS